MPTCRIEGAKGVKKTKKNAQLLWCELYVMKDLQNKQKNGVLLTHVDPDFLFFGLTQARGKRERFC